MRKLLLSAFLMLIGGTVFAQDQVPTDPDKPKEKITVIYGAYKYIETKTPNTFLVYCDGNHALICVLKKEILPPTPTTDGCRNVGKEDVSNIYGNALEPNKAYVGFFKPNGVKFYQVDAVTVNDCSDEGTVLKVDAKYNLQELVEEE